MLYMGEESSLSDVMGFCLVRGTDTSPAWLRRASASAGEGWRGPGPSALPPGPVLPDQGVEPWPCAVHLPELHVLTLRNKKT